MNHEDIAIMARLSKENRILRKQVKIAKDYICGAVDFIGDDASAVLAKIYKAEEDD